MSKIPTVPELNAKDELQDSVYQRIEINIPDFVYINAAADTEVDIDTITLTPGTWTLGYDVTVFARNNSGGTLQISARARYTDNSNNFTFNTASWIVTPDLANSDFIYSSASRQTEVVITQTTTFKLRLTSTVNAVTNDVAIAGNNITGSITGPDNNSILWAERKKL